MTDSQEFWGGLTVLVLVGFPLIVLANCFALSGLTDMETCSCFIDTFKTYMRYE